MENDVSNCESDYLNPTGSENDEIANILRNREKKWATPIPEVNYPKHGSSLRKAILDEDDYEHLMHEVKGTKFGDPARPELSVLLVGFGAKTPPKQKKKSKKKRDEDHNETTKARDETKGLGLELLYDRAKSMYIMSLVTEDKLLLLLQNDPEKAQIIESSISKNGNFELNYVDNTMQKQWRRFLRIYITPLLNKKSRMNDVIERYFQRKASEDNVSSDDSEDEKRTKKKKKRKQISTKIAVDSGEPADNNNTRATISTPTAASNSNTVSNEFEMND